MRVFQPQLLMSSVYMFGKPQKKFQKVKQIDEKREDIKLKNEMC